jgi:type VI secretion system protein ImpF
VAETGTLERLQPALLDRLQDDDPAHQVEPLEKRFMSKRELRAAVLRDLRWLLNATCLEVYDPVRRVMRDDLSRLSHVRSSVVNYGLPPMSGRAASSMNADDLESAITEAIAVFEPRILRESLQVSAIIQPHQLDHHNVIGVEIHGQLWNQPVPIEIMLRTEIDLESGAVAIKDSVDFSPSQAT